MTPEAFARAFAEKARTEANRRAKRWAEEHGEDLARAAGASLEPVLERLANGQTRAAKRTLLLNADTGVLLAFMRKTTDDLRQIRRSRARVLKALRRLGAALAEAIGQAGLAALRSAR